MRTTKAHLRSLISVFVVRCLDSIIPLLAIADISRQYLVSSAGQAGLSVNWSQTPKTGFLVTGLNFKNSNKTQDEFHIIIFFYILHGSKVSRESDLRNVPCNRPVGVRSFVKNVKLLSENQHNS